MNNVTSSGSLDDALAKALALGRQELVELASTTDGAMSSYDAVGTKLVREGERDGLTAEFDRMRTRFADGLSDHLLAQSKVLSTFNIAFFGRTGSGKSTLLSAFGELDGSAVSPFGESDWTTEVKSVPWRGCQLYDTPGINGWGGRKSRYELEAVARKAVETADVVLLCFDTQSQQASEFAKVADWVTHYGKPVVAVLNVRNPRWRHSARVSSQTARRNMSEPVAQHADNVRVELSNIGLRNVPVVAISSRRALFARASTPYQGPATQNFLDDRDRYGTDYLARSSNFAALEGVLSAGITAGGSELRLESLREGIRARLTDEADSLTAFSTRLIGRAAELDGLIRRNLEVLGYLEPEQRSLHLHDDVWHSDLLTLAESSRGGLYTAPVDGTFVRHVRNLVKPHLAEARSKALLRYKTMEHRAFTEGTVIDKETFAAEVFDTYEIEQALERVSVDAAQFLDRELSLAGLDFSLRNGENYTQADLKGDAGDTAGLLANMLRGAGLLGSVGSIAVPLLLAGPAGWVAGVGVGVAAAVFSWAGTKKSRDAEREETEARAKAVRQSRSAINASFDEIERQVASVAAEAAWTAAAPLLRSPLIELVISNNLDTDIGILASNLRTQSSAIPVSPPRHMLDAVFKTMQDDRGRGDKVRVGDYLLGEDWFDHDETPESSRDPLELRTVSKLQHDSDIDALHRAMVASFTHPEQASVAAWLSQAASAADVDEAFTAITDATRATTRPAIVVAGDYSAGKSSFIKRVLAEFDRDVPNSLHIRADATTDAVHRYSLGPVDIVDTPGFQSRHASHDELALTDSLSAALVIVVLHVNLLIGDTTALRTIADGTSTVAGKKPRILFVVNRCDELGVDPLDSPEEYFHRRGRKLGELAASLNSSGIEVSSELIHGIAADPFGGVGAETPVTSAHYDANRTWDGIPALVDTLRRWIDDDLAHATALAAFDDAVSVLLRLREETRASIANSKAEASKHNSLIAAIDICLDDANYLSRSLELELDDVLEPQVTQAVARVRTVPVGDEKALGIAVGSWINEDTRYQIAQLMETATEKVNDWSAAHASAIAREEAATGFGNDIALSAVASEEAGGDPVGQAAWIAGKFAGFGAHAGKALGHRDAALKIGHLFGYKFKPWGAIKAGKAVGRVGVVFGVVAAAADAAAWANDVHKGRSWDDKQDAAVLQIESNKKVVIEQLIAEDEGPWAYLAERIEQVAVLRTQYGDHQVAVKSEVSRLQQRLSTAQILIAAADKLRRATTND
ncbi:GTPase [Rhodococcoides fascians]|uniref:GTPase n=1 Tax=Rhodococcoides fascians TaxID=1828 RepID=UPI0027856757|nr:GTPase [Rhodococcus fascians]MDQ0284110.1 putative GTPase [Rhodococcus fascians]